MASERLLILSVIGLLSFSVGAQEVPQQQSQELTKEECLELRNRLTSTDKPDPKEAGLLLECLMRPYPIEGDDVHIITGEPPIKSENCFYRRDGSIIECWG